MTGYQHIDLSLKSHKLYSSNNPTGWNVDFITCSQDELDDMERMYIKKYADMGYQLKNKTCGGQDSGKTKIADYKPSKGYRDGLEQGRKNLARELRNIAEKHLLIKLKPEKENNKVSQKQYEKFMNLLRED